MDFNEFNSGAAIDGLHFICPNGSYYGYFDNLEKPYISMTLQLGKYQNQNNIRFILEGTSGVFLQGFLIELIKTFTVIMDIHLTRNH